jgi:hypothetical protein
LFTSAFIIHFAYSTVYRISTVRFCLNEQDLAAQKSSIFLRKGALFLSGKLLQAQFFKWKSFRPFLRMQSDGALYGIKWGMQRCYVEL